MRIVTFNLRYSWDGDGINSFLHRGAMIYQKIREERPDVIAFQEVTEKNFDFLSKSLSDIYDMHVRFRSVTFDGEGLAIAFLKSNTELVNIESFWLSPTPGVPGSRYPSQSDCPRICVVAVFREFASGRVIRICNTHLDHRSEQARVLGVQLLLSRISKANEDIALETVILGDMNAQPDSLVISECKNSPLDLSEVTEKIKTTFHGFGLKSSKIDYVFASRGLALRAEPKIWDDSHEGIYLSDHYPIEADFE